MTDIEKSFMKRYKEVEYALSEYVNITRATWPYTDMAANVILKILN
jgi:hypothetical protein